MTKRTSNGPIGAPAHRFVPNDTPEKVDDLTRRFKLSDSSVALDGHTLATEGWDLSRAKDNLPVLWAHDSETVEHVLGQWTNVRIDGDSLIADAQFVPREINPTAGMVLDMIDHGCLRMCSVGFVPTDGKPSKRGPGSYDFTRQTLLEASIVPVGSLASALIQARDAGVDISPAREWAKRNLEIDMFDPASGAEPTPEESTEDNLPAERKSPVISKRGLYLVAQLACALEGLGYLTDCAEDEAEMEGDGSAVPAMLSDGLKALGAALIAMTEEEVSELLAESEEEAAEMGSYAMLMSADAETRATIVDALRDAASGKAVSITTTRSVGRVRIGKMLSRENINTLKAAHDHMCRAVDNVAGLIQSAEAEEADSTHTEDEASRAAARLIRERKLKALQAQISD